MATSSSAAASNSIGTGSVPSDSQSSPTLQNLTAPKPTKRTSKDVGWKYGYEYDESLPNRVKCLFCDHAMGSGVHRLKQHVAGIAGNVLPCLKATKEAKAICKAALDSTTTKKKQKVVDSAEIRKQVRNVVDLDVENESESIRKAPSDHGPIGRYVEINPEKSKDSRKFTKQQNLVNLMNKKRVQDTQQYIARWLIESGMPFNATQNESFELMVEAIGQFGPGLPIPTQYQLSGPCLEVEVDRVKTSLQNHEEEWSNSGCTIMTDAWTDRKRRSVMNLCVHCSQGVSFISSSEDSDSAHTGDYIFEYVDKCIDDVGEDKVVQIVTDNASNNMAAKHLMEAKRPNLFWTSCATHTMNLMLEGIGRQPMYKKTIDQAKTLTIFIYGHHSTLSMMRHHTNNREIVRPGVTRFASTFLTLDSLRSKKEQLVLMFASQAFNSLSHSKSAKGKIAYATVFSQEFWKNVDRCLLVFAPLVETLRLVDGDRPSMPWLYGQLQVAKEKIKEVFKGVQRHYKPVLDVIEKKGKGRVDNDLHLTGYFLNPYYFAKDKVVIGGDFQLMEAIQNCVEKFFPGDYAKQDLVINTELVMYKKLDGPFARNNAIRAYQGDSTTFDPVAWWSNYGGLTPNLRDMAIRILSLTTSSSGCERNWSTFEGVHTKKRNRLTSVRLSKLVYVQFNSKLLAKKKKIRTSTSKDILESEDYHTAQHLLVENIPDVVEEVLIDPNTGASYEVLSEALGAEEYLQPRVTRRNTFVQVREPFEDEEFESEAEELDEEDDFGLDEEEEEDRDDDDDDMTSE